MVQSLSLDNLPVWTSIKKILTEQLGGIYNNLMADLIRLRETGLVDRLIVW